MQSLRTVVASIIVEAVLWLGGLACVVYGVRNGFFKKKLMVRRGERIEGAAAMMWGMFFIVLGVLGWVGAAVFSWLWYQGRVE